MNGSRLIGCGAAWLLGVACHLNERALCPGSVYLFLVVGGLLAWLVGLRWRPAWPLLLAGALAMGVGASGWRAGERLADRLPSELEGEDLVVTGVVDGLPQGGPSGVRFRFEVGRALWRDQPVQVPALLSLGWYKGFGDATPLLSGPMAGLRAGQAWRFTVRLRKPHGNLNPHGFDHELHLFEQGVRATGYVRVGPSSAPVMLDPAAAHPVDRWRQHVRDAIHAEVGDERAAGVLSALAVGDQSAIVWNDIKDIYC
jgi:competence protein ComEC